MAEFRTDDVDKIRAVLDKFLNFTWDISNVEQAPEIVRMVNNSFGKLREGQLLLSSDTDEDACILCAWWPWGNGEKISIRIVPTCKRLTDEEKEEIGRVFKTWFGI
jgi:hypothetical protein